MTNYRFFCLDHRLDYEREAHFVDEKLIMVDLWHLASRLIGALTFTFLFIRQRPRERRPVELLASDNVQIQIMYCLMGIFTIVRHNSIPLLQV